MVTSEETVCRADRISQAAYQARLVPLAAAMRVSLRSWFVGSIERA
jgi:hypothetical protein